MAVHDADWWLYVAAAPSQPAVHPVSGREERVGEIMAVGQAPAVARLTDSSVRVPKLKISVHRGLVASTEESIGIVGQDALFAGFRRVRKLLKNLGTAVPVLHEFVEITVDLFDTFGIRDVLVDGF